LSGSLTVAAQKHLRNAALTQYPLVHARPFCAGG
jgi:hypothetical protein